MEYNDIWNAVLTLVILPLAWFLRTQMDETKRLQILLNMTREEYIKRQDSAREYDKISERLNRLEEKIDRLVETVKA